MKLPPCFIPMAAMAALPAFAEDRPHSLGGNLGIYSDYAFRGVSQTAGNPAIQGGFDYAHSSGIYLGTWASNVTEAMYTDPDGASGSLEWDLYSGYAGRIGGDLGYSVGLLQYYYPGVTHFNTLEAYAGITYKSFGLKASRTLGDYFAAADSDGTVYWDASFTCELPARLMLSLHYGITDAEGRAVDYTDWKVGLGREFGGFNFGLAYIDTDLGDAEQGAVKGEDVKDRRLIASVSTMF